MEQTPFKAVFTKKSNFLTQSFDTDPLEIDYGGNAKFLIPRHGDFITRMYLLVDYDSVKSTKINQAHAMLDYVSLVIGGTTIQQETGETLNMRLNLEGREKEAFSVVQLYRMLGGGPGHIFTDTSQYPRTYRLQIPLQFWFNGNKEMAIPLSALRYQEVEVEVGLRAASRWGGVDAGKNSSRVSIRVEYGYAPKEITDALSKRPLVFPTEQFQVVEQNYTSSNVFTVSPEFVNPVKAVFGLFKNTSTEITEPFNYSRGSTAKVDSNDYLNTMEIILDNEVLMPKEVGSYEMYRGFQFYSHFPGAPQRITDGTNTYAGFIYPLAFCLDPMNRAFPNGSINFSTILNPIFNIDAKTSGASAIRFRLYALSMNLLYIEKGISKLVFTGSEVILPRFP